MKTFKTLSMFVFVIIIMVSSCDIIPATDQNCNKIRKLIMNSCISINEMEQKFNLFSAQATENPEEIQQAIDNLITRNFSKLTSIRSTRVQSIITQHRYVYIELKDVSDKYYIIYQKSDGIPLKRNWKSIKIWTNEV